MKKLLLTAAMAVFCSTLFAQTAPKKLQEGMIVNVETMQKLSSKINQTGDMIEMKTSEPLIVGDRVFLAKGLKVTGHITDCKKAKGLGKQGLLNLSIDYLTLEDGRIIKLTSELKAEGKNTTGAMVAEAVLLTPFFLFKKGKNIEYPMGQVFKAYIANDTDI